MQKNGKGTASLPDARQIKRLKARIAELEKQVGECVQVKDRLHLEESTVEKSLNAVAFCDTKERMTYVNRSFCRMWGYAKKDVLGR